MLALDDAALARLMIAATAMPADRRGRWLRDIAAQIEGCPAPTAEAIRQRRSRRRKAGGKRRLNIFVDPDDLKVALQGAGTLSPGEHGDRTIERAYQQQTDDWIDGWKGVTLRDR